jgi:hypothetical protein
MHVPFSLFIIIIVVVAVAAAAAAIVVVVVMFLHHMPPARQSYIVQYSALTLSPRLPRYHCSARAILVSKRAGQWVGENIHVPLSE